MRWFKNATTKHDNPEMLFVYGTLKSLQTYEQVVGHLDKHTTATLNGYRKRDCGDGYTTIDPTPNSSVQGTIYLLSKNDLHKLDEWEEDYERITVQTDKGQAHAYRMN